ncbi:hypothetical protein [Shewanella sp. YLB-07]|uniref:hypothetical protein n=1 Tax=Shewanella sp. YLB-07 TaxID=2601268 RepID=UPI00128B6FC7|nr:hypothetical protein [Shewanella sp. YLB-07]MPY24398.1 hypothetical protein [Shewanella sp. YLB-07]
MFTERTFCPERDAEYSGYRVHLFSAVAARCPDTSQDAAGVFNSLYALQVIPVAHLLFAPYESDVSHFDGSPRRGWYAGLLENNDKGAHTSGLHAAVDKINNPAVMLNPSGIE